MADSFWSSKQSCSELVEKWRNDSMVWHGTQVISIPNNTVYRDDAQIGFSPSQFHKITPLIVTSCKTKPL
jgi:hypothetical protein